MTIKINDSRPVPKGGRKIVTLSEAEEVGAFELARELPFTVHGLIWAASMVVLDANRRSQGVPRLAWCSLGAGIVATVSANLAHGLGHGPIGALVSGWPALALVGVFELLMTLIRTGHPGIAPLTIGSRRRTPLHQC